MIILTSIVIESFIFTAYYPCSKKVATYKNGGVRKADWGKQRLAYRAITDWDNLDRKIKLSSSISTFRRNFFSNL